MNDDIGINTKKAVQQLLMTLKLEHPEILKNGGNIRSDDNKDLLISISKLKVALESLGGLESFKSLSVSALGAGDPCPKCKGTGKI